METNSAVVVSNLYNANAFKAVNDTGALGSEQLRERRAHGS